MQGIPLERSGCEQDQEQRKPAQKSQQHPKRNDTVAEYLNSDATAKQNIHLEPVRALPLGRPRGRGNEEPQCRKRREPLTCGSARGY
jgi:hypothetical protein